MASLWSWYLSAASLLILWQTGSKKRWAFALGGLNQCAWAAYGLTTDQFGFVPLAFVYFGVYARNWWRWRPTAVEATSHKPCAGCQEAA